jgi:hypothetical protein
VELHCVCEIDRMSTLRVFHRAPDCGQVALVMYEPVRPGHPALRQDRHCGSCDRIAPASELDWSEAIDQPEYDAAMDVARDADWLSGFDRRTK